MPGLFASFETDKKSEAEGVEFTFNGNDGKPVFRVRLARAGGANKKYDQVRERVSAPYRRLNKITAEVQHQIGLEVFSEAVAIPESWEMAERPGLKCAGNVCSKDESGKLVWLPEIPKTLSAGFLKGIELRDEVVPSTPENVSKVMEALPDLYNMLVAESMSHDVYRKEALDQDSKNS